MSITTERAELLSRLLDVAALRHDVIAQNVANVNTPGYRSMDVNFEDALRERLAANEHAPMQGIRPEIVASPGGVDRNDGNNVDVDQEMARLQKNSLYYKAYLQILTNELAQTRSAIAGR
jgi:flagellar basal-body rod protein FlgB